MQSTPIPGARVRACQSGGADANGQPVERHVSDGDGTPCRHCLQMIAKGAGLPAILTSPDYILRG